MWWIWIWWFPIQVFVFSPILRFEFVISEDLVPRRYLSLCEYHLSTFSMVAKKNDPTSDVPSAPPDVPSIVPPDAPQIPPDASPLGAPEIAARRPRLPRRSPPAAPEASLSSPDDPSVFSVLFSRFPSSSLRPPWQTAFKAIWDSDPLLPKATAALLDMFYGDCLIASTLYFEHVKGPPWLYFEAFFDPHLQAPERRAQPPSKPWYYCRVFFDVDSAGWWKLILPASGLIFILTDDRFHTSHADGRCRISDVSVTVFS